LKEEPIPISFLRYRFCFCDQHQLLLIFLFCCAMYLQWANVADWSQKCSYCQQLLHMCN